MSIIYREEIGFEGILNVEEDGFYIHYNFQGPDSRYSGTNLIIQGLEIDDYIKAWDCNFEEYLRLREKNKEKYVDQKVMKGMTIKIGGLYEGVCLRGNHLPVNTKRKLKKVMESLTYAKEKGSKYGIKDEK